MVFNADTLFIARTLIELDITDSTNAFTQQLIAAEAPVEGTVVYAHHQFAGKGQRGAAWESEAYKNFTFSLLLKPSFLNVSSAFELSKCIALGVYDYLFQQLGGGIKIKWPNDIYYLNKKLAGILIENTVRGQQIIYSVAGIGVNINQTEFKFAPIATSAKVITGQTYDLPLEFLSLCKALEKRYLQLKAGYNEQLTIDYLNALYGYMEHKKYRAGDRIFEACITSITPEGRLALTDQQGTACTYDLKEIQLILEP